MYNETRFTRVVKDNAELGEALLQQAQEEVDSKWERLELFKGNLKGVVAHMMIN